GQRRVPQIKRVADKPNSHDRSVREDAAIDPGAVRGNNHRSSSARQQRPPPRKGTSIFLGRNDAGNDEQQAHHSVPLPMGGAYFGRPRERDDRATSPYNREDGPGHEFPGTRERQVEVGGTPGDQDVASEGGQQQSRGQRREA